MIQDYSAESVSLIFLILQVLNGFSESLMVSMTQAIRTDQVSVLEVESIELIACLLGVVYVFVYHKCRALGVVGDTLANLPRWEKNKVSTVCPST